MSVDAFSRESDDMMSLLDYDFIERSSSDENAEVTEMETSAKTANNKNEVLFAPPCTQELLTERPSPDSKNSQGDDDSNSIYGNVIRDAQHSASRYATRCLDNAIPRKRLRLANLTVDSACISQTKRPHGTGNRKQYHRRNFPMSPTSQEKIHLRLHNRLGSRSEKQQRSLNYDRRLQEGHHRRRFYSERRIYDQNHSHHRTHDIRVPLEKYRVSRQHDLPVHEELNEILQREKHRLASISNECDFRVSSKNRWAAVLTFSSNAESTLCGPQITWEYLLHAGPELRNTFEIRPRISLQASAAREAVLRGESFIAALGSAEETLSWLKLHAVLKLRLVNHDPIFKTAGAVLDNLRLKLAPIMMCKYGTEKRSMGDMLRRSAPEDINDSLTLCLILLSRIRRVMHRTSGSKYSYMIDPRGCMIDYVPGECMTNILRYVDAHTRRCSDPACNLYISCTLMPIYIHGRYFYCNTLFGM